MIPIFFLFFLWPTLIWGQDIFPSMPQNAEEPMSPSRYITMIDDLCTQLIISSVDPYGLAKQFGKIVDKNSEDIFIDPTDPTWDYITINYREKAEIKSIFLIHLTFAEPDTITLAEFTQRYGESTSYFDEVNSQLVVSYINDVDITSRYWCKIRVNMQNDKVYSITLVVSRAFRL